MTLLSVQLTNGVWDDRVFKRSAGYGTAMAVMALLAKDLPPPAKWRSRSPVAKLY